MITPNKNKPTGTLISGCFCIVRHTDVSFCKTSISFVCARSSPFCFSLYSMIRSRSLVASSSLRLNISLLLWMDVCTPSNLVSSNFIRSSFFIVFYMLPLLFSFTLTVHVSFRESRCATYLFPFSIGNYPFNNYNHRHALRLCNKCDSLRCLSKCCHYCTPI